MAAARPDCAGQALVDSVQLIGELAQQAHVRVAEQLLDVTFVREAQRSAEVGIQVWVDLSDEGQITGVQRGQAQQLRGNADGVQRSREAYGPGEGHPADSAQGAAVAEETDVELAFAAPRHVAGHGANHLDQTLHLRLVL